MGPSYVHRLLWGLTLVHKMVPIYIVSYVLLWVHFMYAAYCCNWVFVDARNVIESSMPVAKCTLH